ncbi:MAG TPA: ATP-binding protein [Bacteroidota bacterium]|nr:ATP-binding protein [Bacteroidota bacterium]
MVFSILFLIGFGVEQFYLYRIENHWESISSAEEQEIADYLQSEFITFQNETLELSSSVLQSPEFQTALRVMDRNTLFEILARFSEPDVSFEIYDDAKKIISWSGNRGPSLSLDKLTSQQHSFVQQGPIYSYFNVINPIYSDQDLTGYIVVKRLFEVNYPISNRFINDEVFISSFEKRSNVEADFDFTGTDNKRTDERTFSVELNALKGEHLGYAYLSRPLLLDRREDVKSMGYRLLYLLIITLFSLLCFECSRWIRRNGTFIYEIIFWTFMIWSLRYLFILADFPSRYFHLDIFDPIHFASPFGFGLAKSLGDLFVTTSCLLLNVGLIISYSSKWLSSLHIHNDKFSNRTRLFLGMMIALLAVLLFLSMRGFAATIHSAVYDASLPYNDPTLVIPSFELSIMLLSLMFVALSLTLTAIGIIYTGFYILKLIFVEHKRDFIFWLILLVSFSILSVLFGVMDKNPLLSQSQRLIYLAGLVLVTVWMSYQFTQHGKIFSVKSLALAAMASFVLFVSLLDKKIHELDRSHIELLANEIVRPADQWLTFLVNSALDELTNDESIDILSNGNQDDIEKLSFTGWARSILCSEGYNCSVTFMNFDGKIISDFHIGISPYESQLYRYDLPAQNRFVEVETKRLDDGGIQWYIGYAPLIGEAGIMIGGVWVELTASKQTLFLGDVPDLLRNISREDYSTHHRLLIFSEYSQGMLTSSTGEDIPRQRLLPDDLYSLRLDQVGIWLDETIEENRYETFYRRQVDGNENGSWIALSLKHLGVRWHFFIFLRYLFFYLFSVTGLLVVYALIRFILGRQNRIDFRTKLMLAFLLVSFPPVLILAYYNQQHVVDRMEDSTIERLAEQSKLVIARLQNQFGMNSPYVASQFSDEQCSEFANELNVDFNFYFGTTLQASSRPEMFNAELLDPRLSAQAYSNIMLKKKSYFTEKSMMGSLPYIVGYRPLIAENDSIIGVISVPTLYNQSMVDEELTNKNMFLYSAYAIALTLSLAIGTLLSKRISSPVKRLKTATQQLASGELNIELTNKPQDELGELEQSFREMAAKLKQSQDQMLRVQRELAWKEMAKQVAHEIKNPLTPMKLSIQQLRQAYKDSVGNFGSILNQVSDTILEQIDALTRIASEFAQYARMPKRSFEQCDVNVILREAKNLFDQKGNISFSMELDQTTPIVLADREELRRVFINIIRNAVQAIDAATGKITLMTRTVEEMVEISISDTGQGIPDEIKDRLFEPSFSTKSDGMGLGLAIVKQIITDIGGIIFFEKAPMRGTTFRIRLPYNKE